MNCNQSYYNNLKLYEAYVTSALRQFCVPNKPMKENFEILELLKKVLYGNYKLSKLDLTTENRICEIKAHILNYGPSLDSDSSEEDVHVEVMEIAIKKTLKFIDKIKTNQLKSLKDLLKTKSPN